MFFPSWGWDSDLGWGWGWAAAVGGIVLLGIFLVPWFFFLLNLQTLLNRVSDRNRAMPAGHVWLNFIPIFNLGWFIYTVTKVRDSVKAEYQVRNWAAEGDFGYNVGLAAGVLAIVSFFMGWVPVLGWAVGIALLVCWIIYWLKTSELKNKLGESGRPAGPAPYAPYPPYPGFPVPPGPPAPGTTPPYPPAQAYPPASVPPAGTAALAAGGAVPAPGGEEQSAAELTGGEALAEASAVEQVPGAEIAGAEIAGAETAGEEGAGLQPPAGEGEVSLCAGCGGAYDSWDKFCRSCGLPLP